MSPRYISRQQALILQLLGAGERNGAALVRQSGGKLTRGTTYETLRRMERKGLVRKHPVGGPGGERYFEATELGRRSLSIYRQAMRAAKKTA